ncbi:Acid stress protein IbaG [Arsenophonus endosymbiont of Aleurodicus dispersus]|uniref:BolA family protein n=1 Tax=Arsenophonus endosymbiont of Aleurodicus dispersus TaxID=235559 RepID=UPI000EB1B913|nr:BolA family protein [Arsenophonus endosymbiont of Aleurodicus dispersus]VAY02510.1 Acid stress protein IbaG [Arsenophonus endosymbiont of Aleurodicus dispersus]
MNINEIKQVLIEQLKLDEVIVNGDSSHFKIIAVGEIFHGMSMVKQHQVIYALLMEYIADNLIHALSINAYTPEEWTRYRNINGF